MWCQRSSVLWARFYFALLNPAGASLCSPATLRPAHLFPYGILKGLEAVSRRKDCQWRETRTRKSILEGWGEEQGEGLSGRGKRCHRNASCRVVGKRKCRARDRWYFGGRLGLRERQRQGRDMEVSAEMGKSHAEPGKKLGTVTWGATRRCFVCVAIPFKTPRDKGWGRSAVRLH